MNYVHELYGMNGAVMALICTSCVSGSDTTATHYVTSVPDWLLSVLGGPFIRKAPGLWNLSSPWKIAFLFTLGGALHSEGSRGASNGNAVDALPKPCIAAMHCIRKLPLLLASGGPSIREAPGNTRASGELGTRRST